MREDQRRNTFIRLKFVKKGEIPLEFCDDDVYFPETLVEYLLERYTEKGDRILDIFTGFGTTLLVAEKMGRTPVGLEYDSKRVNYVKGLLKAKDNLINGDSRKLDEYKLPECDFCLSSPPYMTKSDNENPFTCYTTEGSYEQYLADIRSIYSKVRGVMKKGSRVIIEVANLKIEGELTTLAWDIAKNVAEVLTFNGELVIGWENKVVKDHQGTYGYGYDHSYCLVFTV